MIVLALDTALSATSVAVLDGDRLLAVRAEPMERGHQERLGGLVREAMAEAAIGFGALHRIGVTVGPGSFTGLRVGLAFAKGLSVGLGAPCLGVGTLQALAASLNQPGLIAAAIDARRDQIYLQLFRGAVALTDPAAMSLDGAETLLRTFGDSAITAIGSGAAQLAARLDLSVSDLKTPDPAALARLTAAAVEPIARPEPLYLRAPDAKTIAERAAGL